MPFIIGIAGSSGSGKSTIARELSAHYGEDDCLTISADDYYHGLLAMKKLGIESFDEPKSLDFARVISELKSLKEGKSVFRPIYDFTKSERCDGVNLTHSKRIIIVEGILTFYPEELRELFDLKVFVCTHLETCRERRMQRDINERGRSKEDAMRQWETVLKAYHEYVEPTREDVDILIVNNSPNDGLQFDISAIPNSITIPDEKAAPGQNCEKVFHKSYPKRFFEFNEEGILSQKENKLSSVLLSF